MSARRSSIVLITVAVVLVAVATVVRFVLAPNATKLPGDTDQTVHYAGEAMMLDSKALQSGDTAHALRSDIPITVDRRVQVTSVHGDTAVLKDATTIHLGKQSLSSAKAYALDRETRRGTSPPASKSVEPSRGALSSAFPPDAEQNDSYTYYDSTTRSIVPVRYTGTAKREGRAVNVYKITVSAPVTDPAVLKPLPPALPKKLVAKLLPELDSTALSALPDPVPIAYQGRSTLVAYIDQQTGIAIDQTVSRTVVASTGVGDEPTSLLPVSSFTFSVTPASMRELGDKAASAGLLLTLLTDVTPLVLIAIAAAFLLISFLQRRKRQPGAPAPKEPAPATSASGTGTTE
ncbi:porin PorA family protein [Streptomyces sp. NPDC048737]|uniref:porin PorA family protein n=1 Tax=unclassified Streptomyces TaxID=2593676 RepID=UPI003432BC12